MAGPDNDYWDHVDWIVDRANALGLYIAFLPTWGDNWNLKWGEGPEIFTPDNARAFAECWGGAMANEGWCGWWAATAPSSPTHIARLSKRWLN